MTALNTDYNSVPITDAHVHFWDITRFAYPWLAEVPEINRTFGLNEYRQATSSIPIEKMIFVQCECSPHQYVEEVGFISQLAERDGRICGIVAYGPLEKANAEAKLQAILANPLVKGIRRLQEDPIRLYENPIFVDNMNLLRTHNLSFDLCVKAHQLQAAVRLVEQQPDNRYILDHFGKPNIKGDGFENWKLQIRRLASYPNVYCKLSGLVTEADWQRWTFDDLRPYVETVFKCFGTDRVVFGGDWPVVTLAASYSRWFNTAWQLCNKLSPDEQYRVFYQNALDFYRINR